MPFPVISSLSASQRQRLLRLYGCLLIRPGGHPTVGVRSIPTSELNRVLSSAAFATFHHYTPKGLGFGRTSLITHSEKPHEKQGGATAARLSSGPAMTPASLASVSYTVGPSRLAKEQSPSFCV
ncbi:Piso0_001565 [Millerozyma farinosa CBS 7064]|uniref:Piso0_001565 protein n=1 Tax=Pichia sorbitophila (strain ATCC MYA-4447 / BCRC 22081 / CBS 7064 / NBRC 10061 / NRRL Y-12695) TaxID=559304 RepID=G8YL49_PICSO|nr:Piso0_001565 [Millerozyma farinosa CBS 7064]